MEQISNIKKIQASPTGKGIDIIKGESQTSVAFISY